MGVSGKLSDTSMSSNEVTEIVKELRLLAKRKPLRGADLLKAKANMRELKRMSFGNREIAELLEDDFSEATVKLYTSNVAVDKPEVKDSICKTLAQLIERGFGIEDVEKTLTIHKVLEGNNINIDDAASFVNALKTDGENVKDAVATYNECRNSELSLSQLKEALSIKQELEKSRFSFDNLRNFVELSRKYGGPSAVLEGIGGYGNLKMLGEAITKAAVELKQVQKEVSESKSEYMLLQKGMESAKGLLDLYHSLKEKGYDLATLEKLSALSHSHGGISKFLQGIDKYRTLLDLDSEERTLNNDIRDKKSAHTALAAKYAHLKTIALMCDKLLRRGFTTEAIASVYSSSKKYGEPVKVLRAIETYGDLQKIIKERGQLALEKQELEARTREAEQHLNVIRAQYDELKTKSTESLDGLVTGVSGTTKAIEKKALEAMESISQKYETYSERLGQLKAEGGHFEEELNLARVVLAMKKYPSEIKDLPLDYALQLLEAVERLCWAKGLDPKVKAPDWVRKEYYFLPTEIQFSHLIAMVKEELINQIGGVKK